MVSNTTMTSPLPKLTGRMMMEPVVISYWPSGMDNIHADHEPDAKTLRAAIGLTPAQMDQIFVAGSGVAP